MKAGMIRTLTLASVIIAAGSSGAFAQDAPDTPQTSMGPMIVDRVHNGFAGAPEFKVTQLDSTTGNLVGGYGGYMVDNTFLVGGGWYWLTNSGSGVHDMWYGGPVVEWLQHLDRRVGFSVRSLIGFGGATYTSNVPVYYGRNDRGRAQLPIIPPGPSIVPVRFEDDFFVAEPQASVLFNLNPKIRVGFTGGYRLVGGAYQADDRLRGATLGMSVQFGGSTSVRIPQTQ